MGLINACSDPQPPTLGGKKETIMKKTYINPAMEIVKLETKNVVLTTSTVGVSSENYSNGTLKGRESDFDED